MLTSQDDDFFGVHFDSPLLSPAELPSDVPIKDDQPDAVNQRNNERSVVVLTTREDARYGCALRMRVSYARYGCAVHTLVYVHCRDAVR